MAKEKKVVLFIVEGMSDEAALSEILSRIFENKNLYFHITRGDFSSDENVSISSVMAHLGKIINKALRELKSYGINKKDILSVISIIDSDGAFINKKNILYDENIKIVYTENAIITNDIDKYIQRNERKSNILNKICKQSLINGYNYRAVYLSRNLEHALYGEIKEHSADEKEKLSYYFPSVYLDNIEGFHTLLEDICPEKDSFVLSWDFIKYDTNSLKRFSNLKFILPKYYEILNS